MSSKDHNIYSTELVCSHFVKTWVRRGVLLLCMGENDPKLIVSELLLDLADCGVSMQSEAKNIPSVQSSTNFSS